ncbi:MAG: hypothetical protein H7067_16365 [Burkholderiales bacterium]|nr:hypothetical protein [Opitutaceae bacterium]
MRLLNKPMETPAALAVLGAGIVICILMVFPQIPIKFRYLAVVAAGFAVFHHQVHRAPGVRYIIVYTFFLSCVGLAVVNLTGDGSFSEALYGIRAMSLCVLVMIFATNVTLAGYTLLTSAVLFGGFVGMVIDTFRGPAWQKVPFPIFSEVQLMIMGEKHMTSERFGGFTFEAGVIGGMSAIFILLNVAILLLGLFDRRLRLPSLFQIITLGGIVCGLGAIYLSKTKSGLLVLAAGLIAMAIVIIFVRRGVPFWLKLAIWGGILGVVAVLPIGYRAVKNTGTGEYIEKEVQNFYLLFTRGFTRDEGGGLQTRIESMKIAVYSLPFRPTGGGHTNGYFYAKPSLKYVQPTTEMEWFHNQGRYNGYKGALFNLLGQGGLFSLWILYVFSRCVGKGLIKSGAFGGAAIATLLITGILVLGVTVELLPYFELFMLMIGLAYIVDFQLGGLGGLVDRVQLPRKALNKRPKSQPDDAVAMA